MIGVKNAKSVNIPKWVKTDPEDVCLNVKDLRNKMVGKIGYMMLFSGSMDVELICCRSARDLAFYTNYYHAFTYESVPEERQFITGKIYRSEILPFTFADTCLEREAFLICDDYWFDSDVSLSGLTYKIEDLVRYKAANIEQIVVIIGRRMKDSTRDAMNEAIRQYSDTSLWEKDKWAIGTTIPS